MGEKVFFIIILLNRDVEIPEELNNEIETSNLRKKNG